MKNKQGSQKLRYQYYYTKTTLEIEFYASHQTLDVQFDRETQALKINIDQKECLYVFQLNVTELVSVTASNQKHKFTCTFKYEPPQSYEIFKDQIVNKQNKQEKYKKMDEIGSQDSRKDMQSILQNIYENADDMTKRNMVASYQESKGQVISSTWDETNTKPTQ